MTPVLRHSGTFVSRSIGGECLLVRIRDSAAELDGIYTLSEVSSFIWNLFDGTRQLTEVLEMVVATYDVTYEQAGDDLIALTDHLEQIGALRRV